MTKVIEYQGKKYLDMGGTACPYEIVNGKVVAGESRLGWFALAYGVGATMDYSDVEWQSTGGTITPKVTYSDDSDTGA